MTFRPISCYILDDQVKAILTLTQYISETPGLVLIGSNTSPVVALSELAKNPPDILFLDINMKEMSGLEVAEKIQLLNIQIIFTTAHANYALDAFNLAASHYLVKPVSYEKFIVGVKRAMRFIDMAAAADTRNPDPVTNDSIIVTTNGAKRKIAFNDIFSIEASNNHIIFCLLSEKLRVSMSLKELENELPERLFVPVHRSFIVARSKVRSTRGMLLYLSNGQEIPIGRSYLNLIRKLF